MPFSTVPSATAPTTSSHIRTHRWHWMQRFMFIMMTGLSWMSFEWKTRFGSRNRLTRGP